MKFTIIIPCYNVAKYISKTLDSVLNEKTYNEYGDDFTKEEFKNLISDCPIHFTRSIGKEFS